MCGDEPLKTRVYKIIKIKTTIVDDYNVWEVENNL